MTSLALGKPDLQESAVKEADGKESTEKLYDASASGWVRDEPVLLSDYTARPVVLDWCAPIEGARVLDLGCGEGYVARRLVEHGAAHVLGLDQSSAMVSHARSAAAAGRLQERLEFRVADAGRALDGVTPGSVDLVVAVFLMNYLDLAATRQVMRSAWQALKPGGRFVFTVPHPALPFFRDESGASERFHFERPAGGYFSTRNEQLEGEIARRDGTSNPVRCVHKTFTDYFEALAAAGFEGMPKLRELCVTDEHLALDPDFFGPLADRPLHVIFRVERPR